MIINNGGTTNVIPGYPGYKLFKAHPIRSSNQNYDETSQNEKRNPSGCEGSCMSSCFTGCSASCGGLCTGCTGACAGCTNTCEGQCRGCEGTNNGQQLFVESKCTDVVHNCIEQSIADVPEEVIEEAPKESFEAKLKAAMERTKCAITGKRYKK